MTISVEDFDVVEAAESSSGSSNEQGCEFVSNLPDDIRSRLHITVGTNPYDVWERRRWSRRGEEN